MDVIIRLVDTGEVLDLFPKVALENKMTSIFFSDEGSKAIPITIPMTPHNNAILEHANRMDRIKKTKNKIAVIVSKGSYSRIGTMYINGYDDEAHNYSITIAYNEAVFFEMRSKININQLKGLPVIEKETIKLIEDCEKYAQIDDDDCPLTVFPIYLKPEGTYKETIDNIEYTQTINFQLNRRVGAGVGTNKTKLDIINQLLVLNDSEPLAINVPKGICISPFVKVWYVIEQIAFHFGYKIGDNPFKTHHQLKRLTILNNVADAIVGDFLDYKQLLPAISVSEFAQFLWARFGAKMLIDGNNNVVNIYLLRDLLQSKEALKLETTGTITTEESPAKQLKLSAKKSLDKSSTETDTFEEFCQKYNNIIGDYADDFQEGIGGIVYDSDTGLYHHTPMSRVSTENNVANVEPKLISSLHFDWNKKVDDLEIVDITSPDEAITMHHFSSEIPYPYYGIDYALLNSMMEINREIQTRNEPNVLAVCWDMGVAYQQARNGEKLYKDFKYGSIFPYVASSAEKNKPYQVDTEGNEMHYALTWIGRNGLFEHFWKEYDAILRHSNHQKKGKLNYPPFAMSKLDVNKKYILNNHPVLLIDYSYIIGNIDVEKQAFNAMTIGLYEPYDLAKEQSHPVPEPILYKWDLQTSKETVLEDTSNELFEKYKINRPPNYNEDGFKVLTYTPISCTWTRVDDKNPPNMRGLWFFPPTKEQFANDVQRGKDSHEMMGYFTLKYQVYVMKDGFPPFETINKTYSSTKKMIYNSFFKAIER